MALDRTNMVSLLDIGKFLEGGSGKIVEMGDGYTELTEDWAPSVQTTQYVNMKNKSSTLNGYEFSMNPEREYLSDDMQKGIDSLFKKFPTGAGCETYYYRFYKTDATQNGNEFAAIRVPVIVAPASTGGEGGGTLVSSIQINGNGNVEEGFITLNNNEYNWSNTSSAALKVK